MKKGSSLGMEALLILHGSATAKTFCSKRHLPERSRQVLLKAAPGFDESSVVVTGRERDSHTFQRLSTKAALSTAQITRCTDVRHFVPKQNTVQSTWPGTKGPVFVVFFSFNGLVPL